MEESVATSTHLHREAPFGRSSSSTPSYHGLHQSEGMLSSGSSSRPSSDRNRAPAQHISLPPPDFRSPSYGYPYGSNLSPTSHSQSGYGDLNLHASSRATTPGMSGAHLPSIGLHAQKRAYRQRRKDPSCDACRERKVKCDATDITSCSECSSRNVKCQFTKETNRRMSSIKQVQDLERQLSQARKQLHELRSNAKGDIPSQVLPDYSEKHVSMSDPKSRRRARPVVKQDLSRVRSSLQKVGAGLFKPPYPYNVQTFAPRPSESGLPGLPPRHITDQILGQYFISFHQTLPILHWPSFINQVEAVYREDSLRFVSPIWRALFFAVLGCGTLQRVRQDGHYYLEISQRLVNSLDEDLTIDHARCALLRSIVLVENNYKSAGWVCLGSAVHMAQDIGLHCEADNSPSAEDEIRRRVWWSIYTCDRLLSLELGRPPIINEADCEIGLPSPVDDRHLPSTGPWIPPTPSGSSSPLVAVFEVIGAINKVLKEIRKPSLSTASLQSCDFAFDNCIAAFPARHQIRSNEYIQPYELAPLIYLQNARLMLHRHNLTPLCPPNERSAAIDRSCAVGQDTVQILSRCMQNPPGSSPTSPISPSMQDTWEARLKSAATTFLCTHLWRCILLFSFRGDYNAALLCARANAAIGDARPANIACGRYVDFFLRRLMAKIQQGEGAYLESDEEMMAYVSGDLQGSIETTWAWQTSRDEARISPVAQSPYNKDARYSPPSTGSTTSREGLIEWSGWRGILETLSRLAQEQSLQVSRPQGHDSSTSHAPGEVMHHPHSNDRPRPQVKPLSSDRISIANII